MNKRLALGIAAAAVAVGGFGAPTAAAQPEPVPPPSPTTTAPAPAPPGRDTESMISHCTDQLPEDQRGAAAESMRHMMAETMTGDAGSPAMMGDPMSVGAMGTAAMGEG